MGKGVDSALEALNKTYGKGTVGKTKDMEAIEIEKFSSGSLALDIALGGGFPVGRIIEIYGPESSGKTTIALHAIKEVQKLSREVAFIDAEHAFDPIYAEAIGINVDEMIVCQPDNGEQALEVAEKLIRSNEVGLIIIDSVSALVPKKQLEGDHGDANVGLQARMMSQGLMKMIGAANNSNCTVIFINQIRMKIGVMFGSPETTSGGNALKFYASQRLDVRKVKTNEGAEGEGSTSNDIKITVKKNKVAPPFKIAKSQIEFGVGIVYEAEVLDIATELNIIEKSGSWFAYDGSKLGQGRPAAIETLKDNPEAVDAIREQIINTLFPKTPKKGKK